jgi:hypothetical protein
VNLQEKIVCARLNLYLCDIFKEWRSLSVGEKIGVLPFTAIFMA